MFKLKLAQRMGGTGNIYSLYSENFERVICFRGNAEYVVLSPIHFGDLQTSCSTIESIARAYKKIPEAVVLCRNGNVYDYWGGMLQCTGTTNRV